MDEKQNKKKIPNLKNLKIFSPPPNFFSILNINKILYLVKNYKNLKFNNNILKVI